MAFYLDAFKELSEFCSKKRVTLVAVSKVRTEEEIMSAYNAGQRDFGENYVQELIAKSENLPKDIRWHFIGHLQSNKVKFISPFIHLVQGADNEKLLQELNKQAERSERKIDCLLQVHIAAEENKFGFTEEEITHIDHSLYPSLNICGLMGMATFTFDLEKIRNEFRKLHSFYTMCQEKYQHFSILSMGMSGDYEIAIEEGSTMIRVGSLLFGERKKVLPKE